MIEKRNYFFSYNHPEDLVYLKKLREIFIHDEFRDYGFKEEDLGEESKKKIAKKIQDRLWACSISIVLVGEKTGESKWIDWEIWYSLQSIIPRTATKWFQPNYRRRFNPKGILAIFLPVQSHSVPPRLKKNLESGYALKIEWNDIQKEFYSMVESAYQLRSSKILIKNEDKPKIKFGIREKIEQFLNYKIL